MPYEGGSGGETTPEPVTSGSVQPATPSSTVLCARLRLADAYGNAVTELDAARETVVFSYENECSSRPDDRIELRAWPFGAAGGGAKGGLYGVYVCRGGCVAATIAGKHVAGSPMEIVIEGEEDDVETGPLEENVLCGVISFDRVTAEALK